MQVRATIGAVHRIHGKDGLGLSLDTPKAEQLLIVRRRQIGTLKYRVGPQGAGAAVAPLAPEQQISACLQCLAHLGKGRLGKMPAGQLVRLPGQLPVNLQAQLGAGLIADAAQSRHRIEALSLSHIILGDQAGMGRRRHRQDALLSAQRRRQQQQDQQQIRHQ